MGIFSGIKKTAGHFIDFRVDRWLNLKWNHDCFNYFWNQTRNLYAIQQPTQIESFEEVRKRLNLSEHQLMARLRYYKRLYRLFMLFSIILLGYTTYVFALNNWMGVFMSLAVAVYSLTLTFRFHFWHFQISQGRLGCTMQDWCRSFLHKRSLKTQ